MNSMFLQWHPSSANGKLLYEQRLQLQKNVLKNPKQGISYLKETFKFGVVSEIWDDFVFQHVFLEVFDKLLNHSDVSRAIEVYSVLDHLLFTLYIRREESPTRFRRAFWNVNFFGVRLSQKLLSNKSQVGKDNQVFKSYSESRSTKKIAFVFKGPFKLAHSEFFLSFLKGTSIFKSKIKVYLILLDDSITNLDGLEHVSIVSLSSIKSTSQKMIQHANLCAQNYFDHICWVACVQNLSLYMGTQLAPTQSYWSMKYHSIIMPTIQKYAGLGFGGDSFSYDDVEWFRGRAFPDLNMPVVDKEKLTKLRIKENIPENAMVLGCFVRSEKLHDENFWRSIKVILETHDHVHFVIASQDLPALFKDFADSYHCFQRFHHLGWINTKEWVSNLDIYYDSSPRGSCNTIFEAIEADVPVLFADTNFNRESSAFPYLFSASNDQRPVGCFTSEDERLRNCLDLISSSQKRISLAQKQKKLLGVLQGRSHLFAKDYLNYFLDTKLTLNMLR